MLSAEKDKVQAEMELNFIRKEHSDKEEHMNEIQK